MDIQKLSFDELVELRSNIDQELRSRTNQEIQALAESLSKRAAELGVGVDEVLAKIGKRAAKTSGKGSLPPKYVNPKNAGETWSGKGRKPGWFVEALGAGKSESDLLIK